MSTNSIMFPAITFKNMDEIKAFVKMNKTETALYYYEMVKDTIKIIGKEKDVYYYNSNCKLWLCVTTEVYEASLAKYFNDISTALYKSFKALVMINGDNYDEDEILKLRKDIAKKQSELDTSANLKAIVDRSTGFLQDNNFATLLNSNPDCLPIKNGMKVCLKTGNTEERTKTDYFTFECDVEIVENTEQAEQFFLQVMPDKDNRELLRKVLGYQLTGNMDGRCFFIWYGHGSNGKTVIMNLMEAILKPLYHQTSKGIFMKGSQERVEGASPDKVALMGVRCATYSEGETADDIDINESFLKMVSGKDKINARSLFKAPITFYPVCKLNLLTNYKPDFNGDNSIVQRIIYLFLDSLFDDNPVRTKPNHFKRNDEFVEKLKTIYLSQVFSWILKGSIEFYKDRTITPTASFKARTEVLFDQMDSITSFLTSKLIVTGNDKDYIRKADMVRVYQAYCNENSQRCKPRSTLFKRMDDIQVRSTKLDGYEVYRGVRIKEYDSDDTQPQEPSMFEDKAVYIRAEQHTAEINKCNKTIENLNDKIESLTDDFSYAMSYITELETLFDRSMEKKPTEKKPAKIANEIDTLDLLNS